MITEKFGALKHSMDSGGGGRLEKRDQECRKIEVGR